MALSIHDYSMAPAYTNCGASNALRNTGHVNRQQVYMERARQTRCHITYTLTCDQTQGVLNSWHDTYETTYMWQAIHVSVMPAACVHVAHGTEFYTTTMLYLVSSVCNAIVVSSLTWHA